ncbi:hypothetical protein PsorP6_015561 [Peronosclerospora sorghi]|uniref:Uncharacterized protein n=1 Tax=Peronosclerospora sorghi TaxID=230839 RepID=A0ACC0WMV3_9STRA|nr:hypothetical protein PsorP6_015561 [Peronosclerospora sorghi]
MENCTLAPIVSDGIEMEPRVPRQDWTLTRNNVSTSSSSLSDAISGWKLALIITGTIVAVLVSIFLVHRRHVRLTAAQKRRRGTLEQRALDSLFRQDHVTVPGTSVVSFGSTGPASLRPSFQPSFLCHAERQSSMKERGMGLSDPVDSVVSIPYSMPRYGANLIERARMYVRPNASGLTLTRSSQKSTSYGDKSFSSRLSDAMRDCSVDVGYAEDKRERL